MNQAHTGLTETVNPRLDSAYLIMQRNCVITVVFFGQRKQPLETIADNKVICVTEKYICAARFGYSAITSCTWAA